MRLNSSCVTRVKKLSWCYMSRIQLCIWKRLLVQTEVWKATTFLPFVQSCVFSSSFLFTLSVFLSLPFTVLPSVVLIPAETRGQDYSSSHWYCNVCLLNQERLERKAKHWVKTKQSKFEEERLTLGRLMTELVSIQTCSHGNQSESLLQAISFTLCQHKVLFS